MPEQTHANRPHTEHAEPTIEVASSEHAKQAREDLAKLDALLDEIDEVLEDNAEEFVANYVQKGGE